MIPFYDAADVRRLLDMPGCIGAVRDAMAAFTRSGVEQPLRQVVPIDSGQVFALMPGTLTAPHGFGAKIISVFADPQHPQRSHHRGVVVLFDRGTGVPTCLADAGEITEIRTAAATAVATDALARPDARSLAIFGTGSQARSHLRALPLVRPFERIVIWGRSEQSVRALIEEMQPEMGVELRHAADPREAASADVICTVTASRTPILLSDWVRPGAHINLVGSSLAGPVEVDNALVVRSRYIADSRRSVLAAGAEFLVAKAAGLIDDDHIAAEIGEVLLAPSLGRQSANDVTAYKSLGHVVQDLAAIGYVHMVEGKKRAGCSVIF